MIRFRLANGETAMFLDYEDVTVCREIICGEYIYGEESMDAGDFADLFADKETDCKMILVNGTFEEVASVRRTAI